MESKQTEDFSNIITPPDFIQSDADTVVLIDPEYRDIEDVALFLKTATKPFNVYVYTEEMNDTDWLDKAIKKSTAVVVNSVNNSNSKLKDRLAGSNNPKVWYYGPKRFLVNTNQITKPIDYFVDILNKG